MGRGRGEAEHALKDFWHQFKAKFRQAAYGCYGSDELTNALYTVGLALIIVSLVPWFRFLYLLGFALIVWGIYRCFSKNYARRRKERDAYLRLSGGIKKFFRIQKRRFRERKEYRYYRCPTCRSYSRVPRGHGRIVITCPKCRGQFERKS